MIFGRDAWGRHRPAAGSTVVSELSTAGPPPGRPVSSTGDRSLSQAQLRRASVGRTPTPTSRTSPGGCRSLSPLPITLHVVLRRTQEVVRADDVLGQTPLCISLHARLCGKKWYLSCVENIKNQCIEQTHFRLLPSKGLFSLWRILHIVLGKETMAEILC